jgi:hypothetical protein
LFASTVFGEYHSNLRRIETCESPVEQANNNPLEHKPSNFKTRARPFRGFKSDLGLEAFALSHIACHNAFNPTDRLGGQTPLQAIGAALPDAPSPWLRLTRQEFPQNVRACWGKCRCMVALGIRGC